jgi:hypothetical protein
MAPQPALTWSLVSGVGTVNNSGLYTAPTGSGSAVIRAWALGPVGTVEGLANITVANVAPTVATPAAANPSPVADKTTTLSVLGDDDGGEAGLVYKWSITGGPSPFPTFSANNTNAAKNTTATFRTPGNYTFRVDITDGNGQTATSNVSVTVLQTLTTVVVSPGAATLPLNAARQFSAQSFDQFGAPMSPQPTLTWSLTVAENGELSSNGLYTAPDHETIVTVIAYSGQVSGSATVGVVNDAPSILQSPAATPATVTGTTTALSVTASDDGGEGDLTYTWSAVGTPPAAVSFSAGNGSNSGKNVTATFGRAGTYTLQATVSDGSKSSSETVVVTVNQTLTSVVPSPSSAPLSLNATQQFTATAKDQFGVAMSTQPTFGWAVISGPGSINSSGLYSSGGTAGTAVVRTAVGFTSGDAVVTVTDAAPSVVQPAAASPSSVTGNTTSLSILGGDDRGEGNLTYAWEAVDAPASVSFSRTQGTSSAKNTVATFIRSGTYELRCTVSDGRPGSAVTSTVFVTVNQTITGVTVTPTSVTVPPNGTQQFTAAALDQFGEDLVAQPVFTWSIDSGGGSVDGTGLYTASGAGTAVVRVAAGALSATASVTVNAVVSDVPQGLAATVVSDTQIDLSWNAVSATIGGYRIERSTDGTHFSPIAVVAAGTTRHSAFGLVGSTTFYFRVQSVQTSSAGATVYSEYSAVVEATRRRPA